MVELLEVPYRDLLSKPFRWGARGPDFFDCLGLGYEINRRAGKNVDEEARLDGYGEEPDDLELRLEGIRERWTLVGRVAGAASKVGDLIEVVPANRPSVHHVMPLVVARAPKLVLTVSRPREGGGPGRGVHAVQVSALRDVVAVWRLEESVA